MTNISETRRSRLSHVRRDPRLDDLLDLVVRSALWLLAGIGSLHLLGAVGPTH